MVKLLINEKRLDQADKIQLSISYILQGVLLIEAIISVYRQNWITAFLTLGILILTFVPAIIRRSTNVYLPVEFDFLTILFIFASLFLGEIHAYYTRLWWWDLVLHASSGALIGLFGFILVYVINREKQPKIYLEPRFVALFSFAFALAIGSMWEIVEFSLDSAFGFNMQKSGLVDTMWDLIVDVTGALIISISGYFYIKKNHESLLFDRMIKRFLKRNSLLFKKKEF